MKHSPEKTTYAINILFYILRCNAALGFYVIDQPKHYTSC